MRGWSKDEVKRINNFWFMIPCTKLFGRSPSLNVLLPNCTSFQCTISQFSLLIITLATLFFEGGYNVQLCSQKGGWIQILAGLCRSWQTVGSLLTTPSWQSQPKNHQLVYQFSSPQKCCLLILLFGDYCQKNCTRN